MRIVLAVVCSLVVLIAKAEAQQAPPLNETQQERAARLIDEALYEYDVHDTWQGFLGWSWREANDRRLYILNQIATHPDLAAQARQISSAEMANVAKFLTDATSDLNFAFQRLIEASAKITSAQAAYANQNWAAAIQDAQSALNKLTVCGNEQARAEGLIIKSHSYMLNGVPKGMQAVEDFMAMSIMLNGGQYTYWPGYAGD